MITKNMQRMQTGRAGTDNVSDMLSDGQRAADCDAQIPLVSLRHVSTRLDTFDVSRSSRALPIWRTTNKL